MLPSNGTREVVSWIRVQAKLGVQVVTAQDQRCYAAVIWMLKDLLLSSWLFMWKFYSITLCLNATPRNKKQDDEGDNLHPDLQLVYTYLWSNTVSVSEKVNKQVTTHELRVVW